MPRHLSAAYHVSGNKDNIVRDITSQINRSVTQSHRWTTGEEVNAFTSLFEEYNSILDILYYLAPDPREHL